MNLETPAGRLFRMLIYSVGMLAVAALFGVIYFAEPWITVSSMRSTIEPQKVKVRWYVSCEADHYVDAEDNFYIPQVPEGGVYPGVAPVMHSDTEFILTGYPYREMRKNIVTGSISERRAERFDVIEWHVVIPYMALEGEDFVRSNKPLGWKSDKTAVQFSRQAGQRPYRHGC